MQTGLDLGKIRLRSAQVGLTLPACERALVYPHRTRRWVSGGRGGERSWFRIARQSRCGRGGSVAWRVLVRPAWAVRFGNHRPSDLRIRRRNRAAGPYRVCQTQGSLNKFDPTSPFGGYKESGFGREGGLQELAAYCQVE